MANEDIKRKISIFINDKEVKNSLGGIGRSIADLKRQIKEATDPADRARLNQELVKAKGHYADIKDELIDTNAVLDEAKGHFSTLFSGILSGDFKQVQAGLMGISGGIKAMTKAGLAFLATPIGIAIAALTGIAIATKQWVDFNLQIYESNKLVKELTQQTGDAVDAIRIRAEVLKETFGIEFEQSINSAKSLVKGFGISYDEAFGMIEKAAIQGKTKNGEFFDSIKEYPIQFKNAGFSAQDFINIVNTGIDLSIYSDKLPDAIKEANLAITEQTDATKDALVNAFGSVFTDDLLKKVSSGEITTKQALQTIAAESEKVNLNQQQQAQLTADLFKGAGEDAGGSLKIFEALNIALNEQQKPLTEAQQLTEQQLELNKELQGVYTQLFGSGNEGLNSWIQKGKIFATEILLKILKGGVDVYNWFVELRNESAVFSAILTGVGKAATTSFKIIGILLKAAGEAFGSLGNIVEGIFTLNPAKIKEGLSKGFDVLPNAIKNLKNQVVKDAGDIYDALQGKNKGTKISLKDLVAGDATGTGTVSNGTTNSNKNSVEAQAKLTAYKKAEEEITKLIKEKQAERLQNQKIGLAKEIAKIEANYSQLEEKYKGHTEKLKELEILKQQEISDLKLAKQKEYLDLANQLEEENRLAKEAADFDRQIEKAATDEEKALLMLEKIKYLAELELLIEEQKELAKVEAVEGAEKLKEAIRQKYYLKQAKLYDDFDKGKAKVDKDSVQRDNLLTKQRSQAYASMFGDIATLVGKNTAAGKAAAIAQATINTYQGISEVWSTKSVLPEPFATISRIANTAVVLTSGLRSVNAIKSTKTPSYYYGGYTGNTAIKYDQYGKVVGDVHEDEWVAPAIMTQNPKFAANFAYLEAERKKLTKGYYNGGTATSNATPNVAFSNETKTANQTDFSYNFYLIESINKLSSFLDYLITNGVFVSNKDLKSMKNLKTGIEDYEALKNKNKV